MCERVGALTRIEGRAESRASQVHVHPASGAGVGDLRVVRAGHALDDGTVRAVEPAQPEEPRTHGEGGPWPVDNDPKLVQKRSVTGGYEVVQRAAAVPKSYKLPV